jgi:tight adherence protein B
MDHFLPVLIFITVLAFAELGYFALRGIDFFEKRRVRNRLKALARPQESEGSVNILKKNVMSEIPWLNRFLRKLTLMEKMTRLVEQAGVQHAPGLYFLSSLTLAFVGFLAGSQIHSAYFPFLPGFIVIFPAGGLLALLPFIYLRRKRRKRFLKFEAQLPEALDFMARSLKAGHAFSSGLKMISQEMGDPVGLEFGKTLNQINFGVSVPEALINLSNQLPIEDLRFFVIAVLLQRETGGNLAEILENLSFLIRERFKLNGRVRVLAAQGKISAYVLVAVPFVLAFAINLMNPEFFVPLLENPLSKYIIGFSLGWMVLGFLVMKKMIAIRV